MNSAKHVGSAGIALGVSILLLGFGCSDPAADDNVDQCVPGTLIDCPCPDGSTGVQECGQSGTFGDCECSDETIDDQQNQSGDENEQSGDDSTNQTSNDEANDANDDGDDQDPLGAVPDEYDCPDYPIGSGDEYFVAPTGSSSASGTESDPLEFQSALDAAGPGDTVTLLDGEYSGHFHVNNNGEDGAPIIIRADNRHEAVLVGEHLNNYTIDIQEQSHIVVRGLRIDTWDQRSQWLNIRDSEHIRFEDMFLIGGQDFTPVHIYDSKYVSLVDSAFREANNFDNLRVQDNRYLLVEGNSFSRSFHGVVGISNSGVTNSNQHVVIRGNVSHGVTSRNLNIQSARRVLFEHNLMVNGFNGPGSASARAKFNTDDSILRFNRAFLNRGAPFVTGTYSDWINARGARLYHNVFADNGGGDPHGNFAYLINSYGNENNLYDYEFANNVFSRNASGDNHEQLWLERKGDTDVTFHHNVFWADGGATPMIGGFSDHTVSEMESDYPGQFSDNHVLEPDFEASDEYLHGLAGDSPLRDLGEHLTETTQAGSGDSLPVEDALYFFDGFGVQDQQGDVIAIEGVAEQPRVLEADLSSNTLELDREIDWDAGAGVSLPWAGDAPDIGAFEHGSGARDHPRVDRSEFVGETGDPIEFSIRLEGDVVADHVEWRMGDGTRRCGVEFDHVYEDAYDYPVTVRIETESGRTLRAADYVMVNDPETSVDVQSLEYNKAETSRILCDGDDVVEEYEGGDWDGWTCE